MKILYSNVVFCYEDFYSIFFRNLIFKDNIVQSLEALGVIVTYTDFYNTFLQYSVQRLCKYDKLLMINRHTCILLFLY